MPLGLTLGLFVREEGGDGVLVCEAVILGEDVLLAVYAEEPVSEGVILHICDAETDSEDVPEAVLDTEWDKDEEEDTEGDKDEEEDTDKEDIGEIVTDDDTDGVKEGDGETDRDAEEVREEEGDTDDEGVLECVLIGVCDRGVTNAYEMATIGSPESPPVNATGTPPVKLTVTVEFWGTPVVAMEVPVKSTYCH